jgi:hypothetical protein
MIYNPLFADFFWGISGIDIDFADEGRVIYGIMNFGR